MSCIRQPEVSGLTLFEQRAEYARLRGVALDECKVEINEILWRRLPATCTLEEAENIAVQFHNHISHAWERHYPKERAP